MEGKVKKWDPRGCGIIVCDSVKYPVLLRDVLNKKPLRPGQFVNFDTRKSTSLPNTLFATNVTIRGANLRESVMAEMQKAAAALGAKPENPSLL